MISIIIRNKNEAEFIGFAIQSCLDYFGTPEIIVMENNSTDDSLDVVQNFNNRTNIIVKNSIFRHQGANINQNKTISIYIRRSDKVLVFQNELRDSKSTNKAFKGIYTV